MRRRYDIVVVTDPRLTGGGNKSLAEEVRAHAAAGYSTALLPLASAIPSPRGLDRSIRNLLDDGLLELVRPDEPVACRLLLARGPRLFLDEQTFRPDVQAERAILVANAVHRHAQVSELAYEPGDAARAADEMFGLHWTWTPLSGVVRDWLSRLDQGLDLSDTTWSNVIDVDAWRNPRAHPPGVTGPIGRHARDHRVKWPDTRDDLLAAYPEDPALRVEILGGAAIARQVLGRRVPANWKVHRFDRIAPQRFLAGLDVFVYHHHSDWIEAFGRTILEALAVGVPAIVPEYLQAVFDEGAVYGTPASARSQVDALLGDPGAWQSQRDAGLQIVAERFSHRSHVERIRELIGPPSGSSTAHLMPASHAPAASSLGGTDHTRIGFFSDNGHGLGHITRLMAIARQLPDGYHPVFLTLSESHEVVAHMGFGVEYFPSSRKLAIDRRRWDIMFYRRLKDFVRQMQPSALVVDHVNPPVGIRRIREEHPDLALVWIRRGLWRQGRNRPGLRMNDAFDLVIEPLDLASPIDLGQTIRLRDQVHVSPITLMGQDDLVDRAEARAELGLPPDRPALLLQLSADGPVAMGELIGRARDLIREISDIELFAPLHVLHAHALEPVSGVTMRRTYPISRYLRAFDAAISTAGYNSFHELIMGAIPTLYVARETTALDDQKRRAAMARTAGAGLHLERLGGEGTKEAVAQLLDPDMQARLIAAASTVYPGNGAPDAATRIAAIADEAKTADHRRSA